MLVEAGEQEFAAGGDGNLRGLAQKRAGLDYSTLQTTDRMSSSWGAPPAKARAAR